MKAYVLCAFLVICFQAVSASNETEQHKLQAICEWFYNNEGKREEESNCSTCVYNVYKENPEPTDDQLNTCHERLPARFQTCDACKTKLGRLLELQRYREEVMKIFGKHHTKILNTKEQLRTLQVWIMIHIIHLMKKDLPKPDLNLITRALTQCLTPGTTAASGEVDDSDPEVEALMSKYNAFKEGEGEAAKEKKRDAEDSAQHRTLIKNVYKKLWNLYVCFVNALMGNRDSNEVVRDFMKTYEGVVPVYLAKILYKCRPKTAGNEA